MKAELINIGDELLIGQTINTNAAWIGEALTSIGVSPSRTVVIGDNKEDIVSSLDSSLSRVDLVIITGGLGPTNDDITKYVLAEYFDSELSINEDILDHVSSFFKKHNKPMLEVNRLQALLPDDCIVLKNNVGTASGMWFERNNKVVISIPGVPFEVKYLIEHRILNRLTQYFSPDQVYNKTVLTTGMGESFLAKKIKTWEDSLEASNIKLAYLPSSDGRLKLRLSSTGKSLELLAQTTKVKIEELTLIIPDLIFGFDNDNMANIVGKLLLSKNKKIATAESCTGGHIAHLLTSIPGSSAYYEGSAITYSYDSKSDILNVPKETLLKSGAVSEEVVRLMAVGLFNRFNIDYAIAVSGIAGPDGGTESKPVGTVCMAIGTRDNIKTYSLLFGKDRMRNIKRSSLTALNILRKQLM